MMPLEGVGAHNSVVGADQGFRAPSWDQESVRDSVHEDSASARIAAGQRPRQSFRHPQGPNEEGAALGLCWRTDAIEAICSARKPGQNPR